MTKKEMMNYWEEMGMKFFSENVRNNIEKMNTEEELADMINNWIELMNPKAKRI